VSVRAPRGASALFPSDYFAAANQEATVFAWRSDGEPVVRTLALTLTAPDVPLNQFNRNFSLAWRVRSGVDAISVDYLMDALGTQQVSLPCDAVDVSLLTQVPDQLAAYQAPQFAMRATACIADGAVSSRSATYTSQFFVATSGSVVVKIPQGARAWRLAGNDPLIGSALGASPTVFSPLVLYSIPGNYDSVTVNGFSLAQLTASDGFLPLPGQALGGLIVSNSTTVGVGGYVIWELDL